jgi:hypothetical protein
MQSIVPRTRITKYGRTWHMAQYEQKDGVVLGRIGFDVELSAGWDEKAGDFGSVRPAQVSQFAINLAQMRVAFQLRGRTIKPWSFQYAFEDLINEPGFYEWVVQLEGVEQPPWEEWRTEVTRITEITATLYRPNPHYPSEEIEHLFEEAKLASATLGAKGDSIEPDGGILKAAIAHVLNGYGKLRAKGVKVEGAVAQPDQWNSEAASETRQIDVPLDPKTGELNPDDLPKTLEVEESEAE